jgi:hypothetical protein
MADKALTREVVWMLRHTIAWDQCIPNTRLSHPSLWLGEQAKLCWTRVLRPLHSFWCAWSSRLLLNSLSKLECGLIAGVSHLDGQTGWAVKLSLTHLCQTEQATSTWEVGPEVRISSTEDVVPKSWEMGSMHDQCLSIRPRAQTQVSVLLTVTIAASHQIKREVTSSSSMKALWTQPSTSIQLTLVTTY